jgi:GTP-binding protein Era
MENQVVCINKLFPEGLTAFLKLCLLVELCSILIEEEYRKYDYDNSERDQKNVIGNPLFSDFLEGFGVVFGIICRFVVVKRFLVLRTAVKALTDADVLLYVTDVLDSAEKNAFFLDKVKKMDHTNTILIINKIDLIDQKKLEELVEFWRKELPNAEIFPLSAAEKFGIDQLFERIKALLPDSPPFFDKDALTDRPERFFVNEIIREKILLNYDKEIPYAVEVMVEEFKEEENLIRISAVVFCERDSQKGIIIGKQGAALRKVGTDARKDIEAFFDKKVFLQLYVKVEKDWRNRERKLRNFGYQLEHKD